MMKIPAVLIFLLAGPALAQTYPSLDQIRDFLDGDEQLWPVFEACAETWTDCKLVAGFASYKEKNYDQAETFYLRALENGDTHAVMAMIMLQAKRNDPIETYAWSQLALSEMMAETSTTIHEHRKSWPFYQLAKVARGFNDREWDTGDRRSQELVDQWLGVLQAHGQTSAHNSSEAICPFPDLSASERSVPKYPRAMARWGKPGWAYVRFTVNRQGEVIDQTSLLYSDRRFAYNSEQAIKKWRFNPIDAFPECTQRSYSQTLIYTLQ